MNQVEPKKAKTVVVLDTNFLLVPGQFGVDTFAELDRICDFNYEICVLPATVAELNKFVNDKNCSAKDRRAARLALQLIKAKGVLTVKPERKVFKSADKAILDFATAGKNLAKVVVATQDKALRDKLKAKGVSVVVLRQKQYLMLYS